MEYMFKNLEQSLVCEIQKTLTKEFQKFKLQGKYLAHKDEIVKKSPNRFTTLNENWSHSDTYYDCIGFRVKEDDIILIGLGLYQLDQSKKGIFEVSIYKDEMKNEKLFHKEIINLANCEINYVDKIGDYKFTKELPLEKETKYIIVKANVENNPNGTYGKIKATNTHPFEFFCTKDASFTYKVGNYSDINIGAFPYFLYI